MSTRAQICIAITVGEPAGIGPDICLQSIVAIQEAYPGIRFVLIGDMATLRARAQLLSACLPVLTFVAFDADANHCQVDDVFDTHCIRVLDVPLVVPSHPGLLDVRNAPSVLKMLDVAINGALGTSDAPAQQFDAVVTAPVHKQVINDFGIPFSGHTEYFAEKTNTALPVMMLACPSLRVALASTHLPLKDVPAYLTHDGILSILQILHHDLQHKFGIQSPKILVAGLNPHAGEGGVLGREELDTIIPALQSARAIGIDAIGPLPADTLFTPYHLKDADAVLAMYHDQGLPVLKYVGFGQSVNVTLGLPIVRTSVDHGTALELAGTGKANNGSFKAAIEMAVELANIQRLNSTHK